MGDKKLDGIPLPPHAWVVELRANENPAKSNDFDITTMALASTKAKALELIKKMYADGNICDEPLWWWAVMRYPLDTDDIAPEIAPDVFMGTDLTYYAPDGTWLDYQPVNGLVRPATHEEYCEVCNGVLAWNEAAQGWLVTGKPCEFEGCEEKAERTVPIREGDRMVCHNYCSAHAHEMGGVEPTEEQDLNHQPFILNDVPKGLWLHYKDTKGERPYVVIGCGWNRTTSIREVAYLALYEPTEKDGERLHFRNVDEWWTPAIVDGREVPRFRQVDAPGEAGRTVP